MVPSSAYLVENHLVISKPPNVVREAVEEDERLQRDLAEGGGRSSPHLRRS